MGVDVHSGKRGGGPRRRHLHNLAHRRTDERHARHIVPRTLVFIWLRCPSRLSALDVADTPIRTQRCRHTCPHSTLPSRLSALNVAVTLHSSPRTDPSPRQVLLGLTPHQRTHMSRDNLSRTHLSGDTCHVPTCHVTTCYIPTCHVTTCHVPTCHVTTCHGRVERMPVVTLDSHCVVATGVLAGTAKRRSSSWCRIRQPLAPGGRRSQPPASTG
jgi:hypothetical protein